MITEEMLMNPIGSLRDLEEQNQKLREELKKRDGLLEKFIEDESTYWDSIFIHDNYIGDRCKLCEGEREAFTEDVINHKPDCPLVIARALLAESKSTP